MGQKVVVIVVMIFLRTVWGEIPNPDGKFHLIPLGETSASTRSPNVTSSRTSPNKTTAKPIIVNLTYDTKTPSTDSKLKVLAKPYRFGLQNGTGKFSVTTHNDGFFVNEKPLKRHRKRPKKVDRAFNITSGNARYSLRNGIITMSKNLRNITSSSDLNVAPKNILIQDLLKDGDLGSIGDFSSTEDFLDVENKSVVKSLDDSDFSSTEDQAYDYVSLAPVRRIKHLSKTEHGNDGILSNATGNKSFLIDENASFYHTEVTYLPKNSSDAPQDDPATVMPKNSTKLIEKLKEVTTTPVASSTSKTSLAAGMAPRASNWKNGEKSIVLAKKSLSSRNGNGDYDNFTKIEESLPVKTADVPSYGKNGIVNISKEESSGIAAKVETSNGTEYTSLTLQENLEKEPRLLNESKANTTSLSNFPEKNMTSGYDVSIASKIEERSSPLEDKSSKNLADNSTRNDSPTFLTFGVASRYGSNDILRIYKLSESPSFTNFGSKLQNIKPFPVSRYNLEDLLRLYNVSEHFNIIDLNKTIVNAEKAENTSRIQVPKIPDISRIRSTKVLPPETKISALDVQNLEANHSKGLVNVFKVEQKLTVMTYGKTPEEKVATKNTTVEENNSKDDWKELPTISRVRIRDPLPTFRKRPQTARTAESVVQIIRTIPKENMVDKDEKKGCKKSQESLRISKEDKRNLVVTTKKPYRQKSKHVFFVSRTPQKLASKGKKDVVVYSSESKPKAVIKEKIRNRHLMIVPRVETKKIIVTEGSEEQPRTEKHGLIVYVPKITAKPKKECQVVENCQDQPKCQCVTLKDNLEHKPSIDPSKETTNKSLNLTKRDEDILEETVARLPMKDFLKRPVIIIPLDQENEAEVVGKQEGNVNKSEEIAKKLLEIIKKIQELNKEITISENMVNQNILKYFVDVHMSLLNKLLPKNSTKERANSSDIEMRNLVGQIKQMLQTTKYEPEKEYVRYFLPDVTRNKNIFLIPVFNKEETSIQNVKLERAPKEEHSKGVSIEERIKEVKIPSDLIPTFLKHKMDLADRLDVNNFRAGLPNGTEIDQAAFPPTNRLVQFRSKISKNLEDKMFRPRTDPVLIDHEGIIRRLMNKTKRVTRQKMDSRSTNRNVFKDFLGEKNLRLIRPTGEQPTFPSMVFATPVSSLIEVEDRKMTGALGNILKTKMKTINSMDSLPKVFEPFSNFTRSVYYTRDHNYVPRLPQKFDGLPGSFFLDLQRKYMNPQLRNLETNHSEEFGNRSGEVTIIFPYIRAKRAIIKNQTSILENLIKEILFKSANGSLSDEDSDQLNTQAIRMDILDRFDEENYPIIKPFREIDSDSEYSNLFESIPKKNLMEIVLKTLLEIQVNKNSKNLTDPSLYQYLEYAGEPMFIPIKKQSFIKSATVLDTSQVKSKAEMLREYTSGQKKHSRTFLDYDIVSPMRETSVGWPENLNFSRETVYLLGPKRSKRASKHSKRDKKNFVFHLSTVMIKRDQINDSTTPHKRSVVPESLDEIIQILKNIKHIGREQKQNGKPEIEHLALNNGSYDILITETTLMNKSQKAKPRIRQATNSMTESVRDLFEKFLKDLRTKLLEVSRQERSEKPNANHLEEPINFLDKEGSYFMRTLQVLQDKVNSAEVHLKLLNDRLKKINFPPEGTNERLPLEIPNSEPSEGNTSMTSNTGIGQSQKVNENCLHQYYPIVYNFIPAENEAEFQDETRKIKKIHKSSKIPILYQHNLQGPNKLARIYATKFAHKYAADIIYINATTLLQTMADLYGVEDKEKLFECNGFKINHLNFIENLLDMFKDRKSIFIFENGRPTNEVFTRVRRYLRSNRQSNVKVIITASFSRWNKRYYEVILVPHYASGKWEKLDDPNMQITTSDVSFGDKNSEKLESMDMNS